MIIRSRRDLQLQVVRVAAPALAITGLVALRFAPLPGWTLIAAAALLAVAGAVVARTPRAALILGSRELRSGQLSGWIEVETEQMHWSLSAMGAVTQVDGRARGAVVLIPVDLRGELASPGVVELTARADSGTELRFSFRVTERR